MQVARNASIIIVLGLALGSAMANSSYYPGTEDEQNQGDAESTPIKPAPKLTPRALPRSGRSDVLGGPIVEITCPKATPRASPGKMPGSA